jgi:hypothetical protein
MTTLGSLVSASLTLLVHTYHEITCLAKIEQSSCLRTFGPVEFFSKGLVDGIKGLGSPGVLRPIMGSEWKDVMQIWKEYCRLGLLQTD